jgi:hypothetical protein
MMQASHCAECNIVAEESNLVKVEDETLCPSCVLENYAVTAGFKRELKALAVDPRTPLVDHHDFEELSLDTVKILLEECLGSTPDVYLLISKVETGWDDLDSWGDLVRLACGIEEAGMFQDRGRCRQIICMVLG